MRAGRSSVGVYLFLFNASVETRDQFEMAKKQKKTTISFFSLPPFFFFFCRYSDIEASTTSRYVGFQIINVLFVSAFAGGMAETIDTIIKHPGAVVDVLGSAIPDTYFFFTSYIMLLAFSIYPVELIQFTPLVSKSLFLSRTTTLREWKETNRPPPITGGYAKQYGYILLSFAITMEFATVAPLLLPFGVLFFGFGYVILRHHVYYVYDTPYDGEGRMFQWSMYVLCVLMIVVLLTLIGIFYSRQSPLQASLMWPLILVVMLFWWYEDHKHKQSFETLSLQDLIRKEKTAQAAKKKEAARVEGENGENGENGEGGRTTVQIHVTSRAYVWMVSHDGVSDMDLLEGVAFSGQACDVYLHPLLLRSRLGCMAVETTEGEQVKNVLLQQKKAVDYNENEDLDIVQMEQEGNMLPVPPRRRGTKRRKGGEKGKGKEGKGGEEEKAAGSDVVLKEEEEEEEDIVGGYGMTGHFFLFRSRWVLWIWSQVLALLFIVGIFWFYHSHFALQKNNNGTCAS